MQIRSGDGLAEAVAWVRAGQLGKIKAARGICYKRRPSIGLTAGPQPVPATVNYDLWCGPSPLAPLRRKKLHYDWHWIYDYGNGDLGNQGIHEMDIGRWLLGYAGLSPQEIATRLSTNMERTAPLTVNDLEHTESQSLTGMAVVKYFFHGNRQRRVVTLDHHSQGIADQ
jgi:hypothetical protein